MDALLRFFRRFLADRRKRQAVTDRDAAHLRTFLGDMAYEQARTRAREARARRDAAAARHWSRVAMRIADKEGIKIGETVADRYEADEEAGPALLPPGIAGSLADIAQSIADLARGREQPNMLHNVGVRVRHVIGMAGSTPGCRRGGAAGDRSMRCTG